MQYRLSLLLVSLTLILACSSSPEASSPAAADSPATRQQPEPTPYTGALPLDKLNLPAGYAIDVFAENLDDARSIKYAGDGLVFVSTRGEGNVYAVQDTDGDMRADKSWTLATGMNMPNGIAIKGEDLYLATVDTIWRWRNIRSRLANPGIPDIVYGGYPSEKHHGWKFIAFGPDGMLYVPIGAPCNICDEDGYASITRLDVESTDPQPETVARGVRNTVGFTWHPTSGDMFFTDNGRDNLGDDVPPCELNRVVSAGAHYGYPYVHGADILDPEFGKGKRATDYVAPLQELGPHVAPLGVEFVTSSAFDKWAGDALIAEHGSWNRTDPIGYRITRVPLAADLTSEGYEVFIDGWLQGDDAWGRPVDLEWLPDGSLLISDDSADVIYRVYRES